MARRKPTPKPDTDGASVGYSTADILRITTATKAHLIHWGAIKLIPADVQETSGSGHHRRFSALNVLEIEVASALNRLQIPTSLIARGLNYLRLFHEQCVALWSSDPSLENTVWTPEQTRGFEAALLRSVMRQPGQKKKPAYYTRKWRSRGFSAEEQRQAVEMASRWRAFLVSYDYKYQHFFGLFINPQADDAYIVEEPFKLTETIPYAVAVINLGAVLVSLHDIGGVSLLDRQ